ncbi:MAG: hypothetical protein HY854_19985 [Burkholderiales bacterium]|nr:hypothetical protein [Burkholderiales bacterium]
MRRTTFFAATLAASLLAIGAPAQAQYAPRQDLDRDGIQNRRDSDRDGDGLRNGRDPNPDRYNTVRLGRTGAWNDLDRDGIVNRYDRDRDGDGVANARDDRPNDRRSS